EIKAVSLDPRNEYYNLNLANAYVRDKKFDKATPLLQLLASSSVPMITNQANSELEFIRKMKEYEASGGMVRVDVDHNRLPPTVLTQQAPTTEAPKNSAPVKFMKARLESVDCGSSNEATLNVVFGSKSLKLHVANRNDMVLIGADTFSCTWKSQKV